MLLTSPKLQLEVNLSIMLFLHALQSYMQKHMLAQSDPKHRVTKYILCIETVYKPHYRHVDLISACVSWSTVSTAWGLVRGMLLHFYIVLR